MKKAYRFLRRRCSPELLLRHRFQDQLGRCGLDWRLRIHPGFHRSNNRTPQRK